MRMSAAVVPTEKPAENAAHGSRRDPATAARGLGMRRQIVRDLLGEVEDREV
jgi:hypothetical protein